MADLATTVSTSLITYYEEVAEKIHSKVDPLPEDALWKKPYSYGNDIGHLVLHLTGNLYDRIGAQVLNLDYKRDRNREFTDPEHKPKKQLLKDFDASIAMTVDAIRQQSAEDWSAAYVAATGPPAPTRLAIFIRCLTHCNHHLAQIIYLTKELDLQSKQIS